MTMAEVALKFGLSHQAVSTVITGIRNVQQAEMNCGVSDLPDLSEDMLLIMRKHEWRRGFWYNGK
jgi:aryl-alcohol dehydrogenase-like predicted oxidoreductase